MEQPDTHPVPNCRVLVVDDEPAVRDVVAEILRVDGHEVRQAADGPAAQGLLGEFRPDVVVSDLRMPEMGGLALMQWAREQGMDCEWIILTGQATLDDAIGAVQLGAFDFIRKPVELAQLQIVVRNASERRRMAREREQLRRDLAKGNERLTQQVARLEQACGLLCDQAETIAQDLGRAELIQRALLPTQPPNMQRFSADAYYRPCRNVGGDLYEVVRVDERYVVAYVADAAGHGVSAAMLAVLFKHRLGALDDARRPRPPAVVLASVNDALRAECDAPGLFVTAAYCLLDTQAGEAVLASAGHTPALLYRWDEARVESVHHTGPALGLASGANYSQKHVSFAPGDRLLLYTDGLYDAPTTDRMLRPEQVAEVFGEAAGAIDGQEVLGHLAGAAADRREQNRLEDDVTMLLLTAREAPSRLDNGTPTPVQIAAAPGPARQARVLGGLSPGRAAFCLEGRGTWEWATAFHEAVAEQIQAGRNVTVDLSLCEYLDSTFLGTIQELAQRAGRSDADLRLQGVGPDVRAAFEELGMERVLGAMSANMLPLPNSMAPLTAHTEEDRGRRRIIRAHRALADLNEKNREEFGKLIAALEGEMP